MMDKNSVMERFDALIGMLSSFADDEVADIRRFSDNGEWGLALDLLIAIAIKRNRGLTPKAVVEVRELASLVELDDADRLSQLTVESSK